MSFAPSLACSLATCVAFVTGSAFAAEPSPSAPVAPEPTSTSAPSAAPAIAPAAAPVTPVTPVTPEPAAQTGTLAGYVDGYFVIGSADRADYLMPMARLQLDGYGYAGPGVKEYQRDSDSGAPGSGLKSGLFARRARIELAGRARERWFFHLAMEGGNNGLGAGEGNTATANVLQDAYVGYEADPMFRVTVGQFNAPFTMENFTSDKWIDFMERSLTVRAVGYPSTLNYGVMLRGDLESGWLSYQVAAMNTEGQDRPSVNNRLDLLARVVVRPLASSAGALSKLHVGASLRYGSRDKDFVEYRAPTMSTPGGYAFWTPYSGKGTAVVNVSPSGEQLAAAAELYVPFERFELRAEGLYVNDGRREFAGTDPSKTLREGSLSGISYYVQASVWPFGKPYVNGEPGTYGPPTLPKAGQPSAAAHAQTDGLQLAVRWEQMLLKYDSIAHSGDTRGGVDADTTNLKVNAAQAIANYWLGRRFRLSLEYSLYMFPGTPIGSYDRQGVTHTPPTTPTNQAGAPGARNGAFDYGATSYHEISARVALAL